MFFIGIFGTGIKEKKIKELPNLYCKVCNKEESGQLIKSYSYFHIFFLPLVKWNESYYIICNNCNAVYDLSKEKGKQIEQGEKDEVTYWDLDEPKNYPRKRICNACNNEVEDRFLYCPHCGKKLD